MSRAEYGTIHDDNVDLVVAVLGRIADTLDDYVDYALAAAKASRGMTDDPAVTLAALYGVVDEAIAKRAAR